MSNNVMNIVNFVRGCEPRRPKDLYTPVAQEIAVNRENGLKSTFLLQYDAMLRSDFQELFLREQGSDMELGLWFEMCRPLTEAVGIEWRGRPGFDWDWYVDPGFLPAYTPKQREMLIDEAFAKFYEIFGYSPRVAGSWLLDAHSMAYMSEKYHLEAMCICREQYAVDAYTLWGGYYSGGYYPSRRNMLCPAQTEQMQINTPVFRMLGIDPIYGYDEEKHAPKIGGCYTMEPCWPCGKDREVMEWYFRSYYGNPSLAMSQATTGQENSFGWDRFEDGYRLQIELIKRYAENGQLRVATLGETGAAFRNRFRKTPAAALSALEDWSGNDLQSVWFSSAYYRANLFRKGNRLYFRDMQYFDEKVREDFLEAPCRAWKAAYGNLPLVDNRFWSNENQEAGLFFEERVDSIEKLTENAEDVLQVNIRFTDGHVGTATLDTASITFRDCGKLLWSFGTGNVLQNVDQNEVVCAAHGQCYRIKIQGNIRQLDRSMSIKSENQMIRFVFAPEGRI